jgi:hypothetical protein
LLPMMPNTPTPLCYMTCCCEHILLVGKENLS